MENDSCEDDTNGRNDTSASDSNDQDEDDESLSTGKQESDTEKRRHEEPYFTKDDENVDNEINTSKETVLETSEEYQNVRIKEEEHSEIEPEEHDSETQGDTPKKDQCDETSDVDELTPNPKPEVSGRSRKRKVKRRRTRRTVCSEDSEDDDSDEDEYDKEHNRLSEQEEEDMDNKQGVTRILRKSTTSLRDSLIFREDTSGDGNDDTEPELPPKRRRKKAKPRIASDSEHSEVQLTDLEYGYKILEQIMAFPRATPFLDQPDETAYGMQNYYELIKKPLWLREIDKKYHNDEYANVTELICDIRQVLQNCYEYWGAGDPLTKKALRVEELLEKNISSLPQSIKQKCLLEATHGEVPEEDKIEDDSNKDDQQTPETRRYCQILKKSSFVSKLLQRATNSIRTDPQSSALARQSDEDEDEVKEIEDWERNTILVNNALDQIYSMWELPVIGHFFYLTFNVLNIEPISQFELERMLLMPQASVMLARVMSTMLIPPLSRVKLEVGPPMPYSIWTAKLKNKINSWYRIYRACGDQTLKVFEQIGVEPEFWLVMGETNPLNTSQFHELSFLQRVWLLKSLCDYLLHNHKTIQDVINNIEPDELREKCLGIDRLGYSYHYFPEFSEVRIYKQVKIKECKWQKFEAGVEEVINQAAEDNEESKSDSEEPASNDACQAVGIKKFLYKPPKCVLPSANNFKLVASSVEDIRCLIDEFCNADKQVLEGKGPIAPLVIRLNAIVNELEPIERKLISSIKYIRKKMHKEWTEYKNRDADYVDPGIAYWERREKDHSEKEEKVATTIDSTAVEQLEPEPETSERRERRSKREPQMRYTRMDFEGNFGLEECDDDEEIYYEEEDDSEDEWNPPQRKKKQNSNKKLKKLSMLEDHIRSQHGMQVNIRSDGNGVNSNNNNMKFGEIKIKKENVAGEKQESIRIKSERDLNYDPGPPVQIKQEPGTTGYSVPTIKQEVHVPSQTVVRTLVKLTAPVQQVGGVTIKRSNSPVPDEVICISDEEADVKPIVDDLRSIKTVDCVLPLLDQRSRPRQQFQPGNVPNQYVSQFPNSNVNMNQMYVNNMQPTQSYVSPVRGPPQQVIANVRFPQNSNVMLQQQNIGSPSMKSPQSFVNNQKNSIQSNMSPQQRQKANFFVNSPNNKPTVSPNNRQIVNNTSPQQMNKMLSPRQNFINSPNSQQSPRIQSVQSMLQPGRGRPRASPNIRMPSPVARGSPRQPMPLNNKLGMNTSPQLRQRSPQMVGQRNMTPTQRTPPNTSFNSPGTSVNRPQSQNTPQARRNLNFNSPNRPVRQQTPAPSTQEPPLQIINTGGIVSKNATTVEGKLLVGLTDDGNYGYHVVLPDGGKVTLTTSQLAELRAKNGGSLPQKVGVPMVHSYD